MGKTNLTYHDQISGFDRKWQTFRRALRKQNQPVFDQLITKMHDYSMAGGAQNPMDPEKAMLVSVCVGQQVEINELRREIDDLGE